MANEQRFKYTFGHFVLETGRDQLRMNGQLIPLQRKSFEVLQVLVTSAGSLVRKEELQQRVWPDREIDDANLSQHIYTLRRVLGDSPKSPSFILTVPGKGYLFNHPVVQGYLDPISSLESLENAEDDEELSPEPIQPIALAESEPVTSPAFPDSTRKTDPPPSPQRRRQIHWSPLISRTIIALSLIMIGFSGYHFFFRQFIGPAPRHQAAFIRPLTRLQGLENSPRFSPDGKILAFSNTGSGLGNEHIYIKQVQQGDSIQLTTGNNQDRYPAWSPDGQQIAFLRSSPQQNKLRLIVIPAFGGSERTVADVWGGLDWSPDGKYFVVSDNPQPGLPSSLWLLSADGTERDPLVTPGSEIYSYDATPRFSPDGRSVAFVRWKNDVVSDLYVVSLSDRSVRQLTFDQRQIPSLAWTADGKDILFVSRRNGNARPWRISSSGGTPTVEETVPVGTLHFDLSHKSEQLAFTYILSDSLIRVASLKERPWERDWLSVLPIHCVINSSQGDDSPRFSVDGSKLVFVSDRSGSEEIWKASSNGSKPVRITNFQELGVGSPRWSPDGQWIAFDRRANRESNVYVMREDGSDLQQLTNHPLSDSMPAWSPDGEWIYFTAFRDGKSQIWRVGRFGGAQVRVTLGEAREALASADGEYLYFTGTDKKLYLHHLATGKEELVAGLEEIDIGRFWDLTDKAIYFVSEIDKMSQDGEGRPPVIYRFDLGKRTVRPITTIEGILPEWLPGLTVTPDERMIAISYLTTLLGDIQLIENWK